MNARRVNAPILVALWALAACASRSPSPSAGASPSAAASSAPTGAATLRVRVVAGDRFSPEVGSAAVKAFIPDVAASDSGGECALHRMGNSNATIATASFPARVAALMSASITFDSAGHVVRYAETRGVPHEKGMTIGMSDTQRDSALKAAQGAVRSTVIMLDYAVDQGVLHNLGGGKPSHAALSSAREVEALPALGIKARMARMRRLCGV